MILLLINENGCFFPLFRLHVYHDRVGGEGGFLENTIRMNLPKGLPLGFGEICVDFWDFRRGDPEPPFLLLLRGIDRTHASPPLQPLNVASAGSSRSQSSPVGDDDPTVDLSTADFSATMEPQSSFEPT